MSDSDFARIESAIRFLDQHGRRQPALAEVADSVGLSEHHFQRLFTRWAGISPKRFLQFQTAQYARQRLAESHTVLDVAYDSGLSGPGRLHDLLVSVHAVTPGEARQLGAGLEIAYGYHDTPFGDALLAVAPRGICGLYFVTESGREGAMRRLMHDWPAATLKEDASRTAPFAERAFAGTSSGEPLALVLKGTNFQLKVWEALLRIPEGQLATYESVAASIGQSGAVRAVGTAVGANPISYLVPCHRVIRKTGAFGNYGGGILRKRAMIAWELGRKLGDDAGAEAAPAEELELQAAS